MTFIQKEEQHPWNLRALKKCLAPKDEARGFEIEQKYHMLCQGPGAQNLETWLDEWTNTYTEGKENYIAEVTDSRPIRDFLPAVRSREPSFADAHFGLKRFRRGDDLYGLIEDFQTAHPPSRLSVLKNRNPSLETS